MQLHRLLYQARQYELKIHVQAYLITPTQRVVSIDDALATSTCHDRRFTIKHVGDVERCMPLHTVTRMPWDTHFYFGNPTSKSNSPARVNNANH